MTTTSSVNAHQTGQRRVSAPPRTNKQRHHVKGAHLAACQQAQVADHSRVMPGLTDRPDKPKSREGAIGVAFLEAAAPKVNTTTAMIAAAAEGMPPLATLGDLHSKAVTSWRYRPCKPQIMMMVVTTHLVAPQLTLLWRMGRARGDLLAPTSLKNSPKTLYLPNGIFRAIT